MTLSGHVLRELELDDAVHYGLARRRRVRVEAYVIGDGEIVQRLRRPDGSVRYLHLARTPLGWKPCFHCGDLAGVPEPERGGLFPSAEEIRTTCSRFGRC